MDLFNKYLKPGALNQINVSHNVISKLKTELQADVPSPDIFDAAAHQILLLMQSDSYERFRRSPYYDRLLLRLTERDWVHFLPHSPQSMLDLVRNARSLTADSKEEEEKTHGLKTRTVSTRILRNSRLSRQLHALVDPSPKTKGEEDVESFQISHPVFQRSSSSPDELNIKIPSLTMPLSPAEEEFIRERKISTSSSSSSSSSFSSTNSSNSLSSSSTQSSNSFSSDEVEIQSSPNKKGVATTLGEGMKRVRRLTKGKKNKPEKKESSRTLPRNFGKLKQESFDTGEK